MATASSTLMPLSGDPLIDVMTTGYRWNTNSGSLGYSFSDGFNDEYWLQPGLIAPKLQQIFSIFGSYIALPVAFKGFFADPAAAAAAGSNINLSIDAVIISENYDDNVLAIGIFPNVSFAQTFLEDIYYPGAEGDVFLNINSVANEYGYDPGEAGFSLALHEIGHALGLKHPHDDGGTGRPTFEEAGIEDLDIDWLTIMSYDDDYSWNDNEWDPATPMILDVIALQYLYGVNTSTNAGNTIHHLSGKTGYYETIFDASGRDKVDLLAYGTGAYVLMPSLIFSDEQYAPVGLIVPAADSLDDAPHQLVWFMGTMEELSGSPFDDTLFGTDGAETISGAGGDDYIEGGAGNDTIDGGGGNDVASVLANFADCTFTFNGNDCTLKSDDDGTDIYRNVESLFFGDVDSADLRSVADIRAELGMAAADDWRLYAPANFFGAIGGSGTVTGTSQKQDITILDRAGHIAFDASFNKGGDIIRLFGDAADWTIRQRESLARLSDGDTFVDIPLGPNGTALVFDDGTLTLRYNVADDVAEIGSLQFDTLGHDLGGLTMAAKSPLASDPGALAKLYLASGSEVSAGGKVTVIGTKGAETVWITHGAIAFDASFNGGGDTVKLSGAAGTYTALLDGSSVKLHAKGVDVQIPVGPNELHLSFNGVTKSLHYDASQQAVFIGNQEIGANFAPLTFA